MGLLRHLASFALLTGMLSPAFRLRFEPTTHGFESRHRQNKNETPEWACDFCGGDDGIRTHDTVARIPHFQCGALDQLCDISGFFRFYLFFVGFRAVIHNIFGNQFRRVNRCITNQCVFQFRINIAQFGVNTANL